MMRLLPCRDNASRYTRRCVQSNPRPCRYRNMAEETVDRVVKEFDMKPRNGCVTAGLQLDGSHEWHPLLYIHLVQDYGIEVDVAQHLANTYGDRAFVVARMCKMTGKRWPIVGQRLSDEFPYLEAVCSAMRALLTSRCASAPLAGGQLCGARVCLHGDRRHRATPSASLPQHVRRPRGACSSAGGRSTRTWRPAV